MCRAVLVMIIIIIINIIVFMQHVTKGRVITAQSIS
jgi:hypothetical protein